MLNSLEHYNGSVLFYWYRAISYTFDPYDSFALDVSKQ